MTEQEVVEAIKFLKGKYPLGLCDRDEYENTQIAIKALEKEHNNKWIPVEERLPEPGKYILLSFSNFSIPVVGRWEENDYAGAFYIGDETETCVSQLLFVNAWMELPGPYKESE